MSGQQITWLEIGAYDRETGASLSIWDKRLIRRLDDAYEAALHPNSKPPTIAETKASLRAAIAARKARDAAKQGGSPSPT